MKIYRFEKRDLQQRNMQMWIVQGKILYTAQRWHDMHHAKGVYNPSTRSMIEKLLNVNFV
jgi:hypothetical protein